jgi:phage FluMu protein Com
MILICYKLLSKKGQKTYIKNKFLPILDGKCPRCGAVSQQKIKDDGFWKILNCSNCKTISKVHFKDVA